VNRREREGEEGLGMYEVGKGIQGRGGMVREGKERDGKVEGGQRIKG